MHHLQQVVVHVNDNSPLWALLISGLVGGLIAAGAALLASGLERKAARKRSALEFLRPIYTDMFLAAAELSEIAAEGSTPEMVLAECREVPTEDETAAGSIRPAPIRDRQRQATQRFLWLCASAMFVGAPDEVLVAADEVGRAFNSWLCDLPGREEKAEEVTDAMAALGTQMLGHLRPLARGE